MKLPQTVLDAMHSARGSALLGLAGAIGVASVAVTTGCTPHAHDGGASDAATATLSPEIAMASDTSASVLATTAAAAADASVDPIAAVDPTAPAPTPAPLTTSCVLPPGDLTDGGAVARKPKPKKPTGIGQIHGLGKGNYCPPCGMG